MTTLKNSEPARSQKLLVEGKQIPNGQITVSGAKNAATKLIAAALLTQEKVTFYNFPTRLIDVYHKATFIANIGADVFFDHDSETLTLKAETLRHALLDHYFYPIRTTYLLAAPQLIRNQWARIPYPGGCNIGDRKYDLHVMVWSQMGCRVEEKRDFIEIRGHLRPAEIHFPVFTVGGTENALICAAALDGTTIIRNAYVSPEVLCLAQFLVSMGAQIDIVGNSLIRVTGNRNLRGTSFKVIPDRIEALTWIVYGVVSGGTIIVKNVPFEYMESPFLHLKESGVDLYKNSSSVYVNPYCLTAGAIQPFELACGTYPGIISDMQPFFVLLGLKAQGTSHIYDYRYPERTAYLSELSKFCLNSLAWKPGHITVKGPADFRGAHVKSTDLRGSMALVIAALLSEGYSTVYDVGLALRGYNNLTAKLESLGVSCQIIDE